MTTQEKHHGRELRGMDPLPTEEDAQSLHVRGRFGRLFPHLPPLPKEDEAYYEKLAHYMGGGGDDDNTDIPAGFTYFGQFLDHDITFDPTSILEQQIDLKALENFRTPAFELDSLYGSGPAVSPHLYDREQPGKFLLDEDKEYDLPRNSQGTALIGDPRNDQNLIIAQLHLAFLKFHNAVYDQINSIDDTPTDAQGKPLAEDRFEKTQRLVRWHYQWIILHEYLLLIVGREIANVVREAADKGLTFYRWQGTYPFIPVEFSVAAYRFGHSQPRRSYRPNGNPEVGELLLFSDEPPNRQRQDLRGGPIKKIHAINWRNFFNTDAAPTPSAIRASKSIDTKLGAPLRNLPLEAASHGPRSLAVRSLLRGQKMGLPSGQDVANEVLRIAKEEIPLIPSFEPLTYEEVWKGRPEAAGFIPEAAGFIPEAEDFISKKKDAPLWYYILREAEVRMGGAKLGPVGGYIVAAVFIGLLKADKKSVLHVKEDWKPVLPIIRDGNVTKGDFTMVDLLKFAGVDIE